MIVADGIFDLRTEDDIFCGKESVTLQSGAVRASTQGDKGKGVSSDGTVTLSGGSYVFAHTSEGIEGKTIEMSGGTSYINGSDTGKDAALDWNGSCRVDGGVLIVSGMKARAEKISPDSAQRFFEWELKSEHPAREQISVQRGDGSMLYWELPRSTYDYVQISCPELAEENTLHAVAGNESIALR